jgi:membrane-associated phospholipid phosphatase
VSIVGWGSMAVGAGVLAGSVVGALGPVVPPAEARAFRAVNGLPDWLFVPLWLPMQLGNLVVGAAAGLLVAAVLREWRVAVAVLAAVLLKLLAERVLRHRMARHLEVRQRPGTSEPGAVLRGRDVPSSGPSFPSGHVILVAAVTCVVVDVLPGQWAAALFAVPLLVMLGRVYVGAHNPLDVTAGLGAGLVVGGALAVVLG